MEKRKYDSTVARIAGNIASGLATLDQVNVAWPIDQEHIAEYAVELARAIVAKTIATEPTT